MTEPCGTYLGIPLERWRTNMVCHLRDERRRNELLQQKLDDANATIARMQALALALPLPLPHTNDKQLVCRLKAEIQDLQDQLECISDSDGNRTGIEPETRTDLNLRAYTGRLVTEALRRSGGNKTLAAKMLGINRTTMYSIFSANRRSRSRKVKTARLGKALPMLSTCHGGNRRMVS